MPTVPNLEAPSIQAEALPGRAFPRIDDNASPAEFGAGLAQGLEQAGGVGAEIEAKHKDQLDRERVIDANTQLEAAKNQMLYGKPQADGSMQGGAFSLHGTAAMNMPATILPEYDKLSQSIAATLTPDQQRLFQPHVSLGKNELDTALNRYEYEEGNRLSNEIYSNGIKQTVSNASVGWRDPGAITKARLDLRGIIDLQGDRLGWSPDERSQQLAKAQAEMHYNVVDRMLADGAPGAALAYFKGVRDTPELTGEQAHQLGAQIDAALNQHKAEGQSALLAQIRDVSTAAMNGQAIPPSSMPSRAAILAAFPDDGDRRYRAMQNDIAMGADLKSMATLTPAQIAAKVDSYKPSGVEGAADAYERYNAVGQAAQRILTQRAQDPRQFVIDNKLGSEPLNFQDVGALTSQLSTRLASTQLDSQRLGGYVPPLSRAEATQFAQSLESMKPADRLRMLAGLNQGLNDDKGFQTIMHQIMPGSPVTAIVGSQLGQQNPANLPVWFDHRFAASPTDQTRILAGEALLNPIGLEKSGEKGKPFPMPSDGNTGSSSGLRAQFLSQAGRDGGAGDLFRNRPELGDAYYAAFKGAYAQLLAEKGDFSGNGDTSLRDQAFKMAIGNLTTVNGQKVAVPAGLDPSRYSVILDAAVNAHAKSLGLDPQALSGYRLEELGGLGSGRYHLTQGNAILVNPGGKPNPGSTDNYFTIDLRGQYLTRAGAKPDEVDVDRAREEARSAPPAVAPSPATAVEGSANVPKASAERETTYKPPPVTGLSRGGGRGGKSHPSQGPTTE